MSLAGPIMMDHDDGDDEAHLLAQLQQLHAQLQELRSGSRAGGTVQGNVLSPAPADMDEPMILVTAKKLEFSLPSTLPVTVLEAPVRAPYPNPNPTPNRNRNPNPSPNPNPKS
mmetsp:Transcript_31904/g.101584  ORF Transcript_31904/g.101584 Transcript_31904/m.101584 type:complete len:113 (-) Transcript_31904:8-346(-)